MQLAIHGAAGRMGRRVVALAAADSRFQITAAIDRPDSPHKGADAGIVAGIEPLSVAISDQWPDPVSGTKGIDTVIDFSLPTAVDAVVERCVQRKWNLVVATTGLNQQQHQLLAAAGKQIAILWAPSMSMAVNLTMQLASRAAAALGGVPGGVDVEIIERHHRFKEDAPSGTALKFGEMIAEQLPPPTTPVHGRHGKTGERSRGEIGYHAVRCGDDPGQHTIVFGMMGETLELRVAASNRDCYASGALTAAAWLRDKPPGLYSMFDCLAQV
jgi:4-hydroxy-tetrahydrodipicolinate reductase